MPLPTIITSYESSNDDDDDDDDDDNDDDEYLLGCDDVDVPIFVSRKASVVSVEVKINIVHVVRIRSITEFMHMSPALSLPHVVVKAILIGAMMMLIFLYLVYKNKYEKETQYILIIGCLYEYNKRK